MPLFLYGVAKVTNMRLLMSYNTAVPVAGMSVYTELVRIKKKP